MRFRFVTCLVGALAIGDALADDYRPPFAFSDAPRYAHIFDLQEAGKMAEADALIAGIRDPLLAGHVLFQRYMHPTAYRSSWVELRDWLKHYGDHPEAERIYRLALRRRPSGTQMPKPPPHMAEQNVFTEHDGMFGKHKTRRIKRYVHRLIRRERPTQALRYVRRNLSRLSDEEEAYLRGAIARSYYVEGKLSKAFEQARYATKRRDVINISDWHAGLATWRLGDIATAVAYFKMLAENPLAETRLVAMGAFWAARGLRHLGRLDEAEIYLRMAAASGAHFYGFLAMQQLTGKVSFNWLSAESSTRRSKRVLTHQAIRRGLALAAAKRAEWGEHEIIAILRHLTPAELRGLLSEARRADFAGVEYGIGARLQAEFEGVGQLARADALVRLLHDTVFVEKRMRGSDVVEMQTDKGFASLRPNLHRAFYPTPMFDNFFDTNTDAIDRALAYATIRQESRFRPKAKSHAGARGLMQIMPNTAAFVTGDRTLRRKYGSDKLYEREMNIAIGNRYFRKLLATDKYNGNLIYTLAGYNAGPGNIDRWQKELSMIDDPLLFLESMPLTETRIYVRRVLENLWIYRTILGQELVSLRMLAADGWPYLVAQDKQEN